MQSSYCLFYDAVSTSHYRELSSKIKPYPANVENRVSS